MTPIEKQAMAVALAWRKYVSIERRLADSRKASRKDFPDRSFEDRNQDARDVRPAASAYRKELETLAQMALGPERRGS